MNGLCRRILAHKGRKDDIIRIILFLDKEGYQWLPTITKGKFRVIEQVVIFEPNDDKKGGDVA